MREIVIISDYPTNIQRTDNLLNLINKVKSLDKEILLTSHISIPEYITSRCDYFLFDKQNELIDSNDNILYCNIIDDYELCSKEFVKINGDYRYAVIKQFILSLSYLKILNYDVVHYLEGDSNFTDLDELNQNYNILCEKKYDAIIYQSDKMMSGSFFSINLNSLNLDNFKKIDKEKIISSIKEYGFAELFTKKEILNNLVFFVKDYDSNKYPILKGFSNNEYKNVWCSFFKINENWYYVLQNLTDENKTVKIYQKSSSQLEFILYSNGNWKSIPVPTINDGDYFDVYVNNVLFKTYILDSNMQEFSENVIRYL